ncbi:MAG: hypothetical protein GY866_43095 [Proteobacteria bacterium]|nr:hypothetical protein [Pseudomonadota bacterium]
MKKTASWKRTPFQVKRKKGFRPTKLTHEEVDNAVREFLDKGGKINKIDTVERSYEEIIASRDISPDVDDFLLGR